ncbi:MAG: hypothetical protein ACQET8_17315 [Bacillota bacterium]
MTVDEGIKLIESFEGIIGAVAGVIFTLIITHILKNSGRVTSRVSKIKTHYSNYNETNGSIGVVETLEKADHASVKFTVDFFNNSETHRALNKFKLIFIDENNKILFELIPEDESTMETKGYGATWEEIEHLNIGPKELIKKELHFGFHSGDITPLKESKTIKFCYSVIKNQINKDEKKEHIINI